MKPQGRVWRKGLRKQLRGRKRTPKEVRTTVGKRRKYEQLIERYRKGNNE